MICPPSPLSLFLLGMILMMMMMSPSTVHKVDGFAPAFTLRSSSFVAQTGQSRRYWDASYQGQECTAVSSTSRRSSRTQLSMMFDQLASALTDVAKTFGAKQRMSEENIKPALRDVRRALLDADVNIQVADTLIEGVKGRALGTEVIEGVSAEQQFIKNMYDELVDMMGGDSTKTNEPEDGVDEVEAAIAQSIPVAPLARGTSGDPAIIILAGLQGAGKTTAAGKLALYLKEREVDYDIVTEEEQKTSVPSKLPKTGRKVLLCAADVYRPAAIKQLQILGESVDTKVFTLGSDADPVDIAEQAVALAKEEGFDTVIIDTAGRQVIDTDLMDELRRIKESVQPQETLLVVDSMTGQEAASLTAAFDNAVGISGAILTKMDGDSRGGAAVSVRGVSGKPIKFVGVGERVADLEPFYPDRMASRILGMGDVISLVEKAAAEVSEAEMAAMTQKMVEGTFDFNDFMKESKLAASMGGLTGVAKMMPGMAGNVNAKQLFDAEKRLKRNQEMISVMTEEERANPDLFIKDRKARLRIQRIADESGQSMEDALGFISEFQRMRTMMVRMQKQNGAGGPAAAAGGGGDEEAEDMAFGNRQMRRAAKKSKKKKGGATRGFG